MSQGSLVVPTSGLLSGLTMAQDMNAALDALGTSNSGASAPNNAASGPEQGQLWLDQSGSQPVLRQYDGGVWLALGVLNANDHIWEPPIGGGAASLASAATVDLGSVPQNFLTITGTTAITSFGTSMVEGTLKVVKFAASLILTYNASSMILPTGASILTAAGDTAIVAALGGGNFEVVAYQPVAGAVPVASGMDYWGAAAPSGCLFGAGQAVSRSMYPALNAVAAAASYAAPWGPGDGSTTFNVIDKRGRVSAAADNLNGTAANRLTDANTGGVAGAFGSTGGEQSHTLTTAEIPAHSHPATSVVTESPHEHVFPMSNPNTGGSTYPQGGTGQSYSPVTAGAVTGLTVATTVGNNTGGGGGHNNMPPTIVCNYIIKY